MLDNFEHSTLRTLRKLSEIYGIFGIPFPVPPRNTPTEQFRDVEVVDITESRRLEEPSEKEGDNSGENYC